MPHAEECRAAGVVPLESALYDKLCAAARKGAALSSRPQEAHVAEAGHNDSDHPGTLILPCICRGGEGAHRSQHTLQRQKCGGWGIFCMGDPSYPRRLLMGPLLCRACWKQSYSPHYAIPHARHLEASCTVLIMPLTMQSHLGADLHFRQGRPGAGAWRPGCCTRQR